MRKGEKVISVCQVTRTDLSLDEAISFIKHFADLFTGYIVPVRTYHSGNHTRKQYAVIRFLDSSTYHSGLRCRLGPVLSVGDALKQHVNN